MVICIGLKKGERKGEERKWSDSLIFSCLVCKRNRGEEKTSCGAHTIFFSSNNVGRKRYIEEKRCIMCKKEKEKRDDDASVKEKRGGRM